MTIFKYTLSIATAMGCFSLQCMAGAPATEAEARSVLKVGITEDAVIARFGEPTIHQRQDNGLDEIMYVKPPAELPKNAHFVYSGFDAYFKGGKMVRFTIVHASKSHHL